MFDSSKKRDIEDELADVFYFILRFAHMNNIDLSTALENKLKQSNTLIVILDYRGLKAMREYCLKNNIKIESYYIQVPLKTRLYRSLKREELEYPDDEHYLEICRRAIADNEEVEIAKYDKEIKVINNKTNIDFLKNILNISESVEI